MSYPLDPEAPGSFWMTLALGMATEDCQSVADVKEGCRSAILCISTAFLHICHEVDARTRLLCMRGARVIVLAEVT